MATGAFPFLVLLLLLMAAATAAAADIKLPPLTATSLRPAYDDDLNNNNKTHAACWKRTEYRGQGIEPEVNMFWMYYCPDPKYPELSRKRCYPRCKHRDAGYVGTGSMCWQTCHKTLYNGLYFCCRTYKHCLALDKTVAVTVPQQLSRILNDLIQDPLGVRQLWDDVSKLMAATTGLRIPICPRNGTLRAQEEEEEEVLLEEW